MNWYLLLGIGLVATLAQAFVCSRRNHERTLRTAVEEAGLEFVDSRPAGLFRTGPFPFATFRRDPNADCVAGDHRAFRIVHIRLLDGQVREVWACLHFEDFRLRQVEWSPQLAALAIEHDPPGSGLQKQLPAHAAAEDCLRR